MKGIFLDTETNGLNTKRHVLVEIAFKILDLLNGRELDVFHSLISHSYDIWKQSDKESLAFTGFTWEETSRGEKEEIAADQVKMAFKRNGITRGEAVFICQNPSFDRAFFSKLIDIDTQESLLFPYHWLDLASMHWAMCMKEGKFPWKIGLSKDQIAALYKLPEEPKPHRAMNGVDHLILCYKAVVGFPQKSKSSN